MELLRSKKFRVIWSERDKEYVGLCSKYSGLSWLAPTEKEALEGIQKVVKEVEEDLKKEK